MGLVQRIGSAFLAAILLFDVPSSLNSVWAADDEDQKGAPPALTLDLHSGVNHVQVTDITAHLEPDSVLLRPLDNARRVQILEQNYRNDPVTQQLLLSLYEGKAIDFVVNDKDGGTHTVSGK